jgi:hypothetical protein
MRSASRVADTVRNASLSPCATIVEYAHLTANSTARWANSAHTTRVLNNLLYRLHFPLQLLPFVLNHFVTLHPSPLHLYSLWQCVLSVQHSTMILTHGTKHGTVTHTGANTAIQAVAPLPRPYYAQLRYSSAHCSLKPSHI